MVSASVDQDASPTLHNYMANLLTLLIAYSKAGSKPRADAPLSEPKTGDSTKVVECPLDILMRYFYRVQDRAMTLPYHTAMPWIQRKDEAERTVWVDRYRNSSESLGEVILHTMTTREAMWELPTPEPRKVPERIDKGGGKGRKGDLETSSKARPERPPPTLKKRADALQDGTPLCRLYNNGSCKSSKDCKYAHCCSVIKADGKVCSRNHAAKDHK